MEKIYLFDDQSLKTLLFLHKFKSYNEYSLWIVALVISVSGFDKWSIIILICCILSEFYLINKIKKEKSSSYKTFHKFVMRFKEITEANKL